MPQIHLGKQVRVLFHFACAVHHFHLVTKIHRAVFWHEKHEAQVGQVQLSKIVSIVEGNLSESAGWIVEVSEVEQDAFLHDEWGKRVVW